MKFGLKLQIHTNILMGIGGACMYFFMHDEFIIGVILSVISMIYGNILGAYVKKYLPSMLFDLINPGKFLKDKIREDMEKGGE